MAGISEQYLSDLRSNNDIVSLIGGYVELKRSGATWSARCPFHNERTASFHVYPNTDSYFCFGCHAGGDAITFIRDIEHLEYMEAVKFLAQRAGMPLPEEHDDQFSKQRKRLYEMNRQAGRFFWKMLHSPEGAEGWQYITGRGLTEETIRQFGIGYAPDDYHKLHMHMRSLGFTDDELVAGALLVRRENSVYDKFRRRVMFPIFDLRGNIIAFGGRALDPSNPAKYLNSDETFVFKKRQNMFALNFAKNSKADYYIMCEGYMDVITMHQAGFTSAVATLGTAITPEQASLLARQGKKKIFLSYDNDAAGQAASQRAIDLLGKVDVTAHVLKIRGAKDPDEFINKFGREAFEHLLTTSVKAYTYELEKLENAFDLNTMDGRSEFLKKAKQFLISIRDQSDREVYASRVAELARIDKKNLMDDLSGLLRRNRFRAEQAETREILRPTNKSNLLAKLPEEKYEYEIICFLFYNPDKLNIIERELSTGFVTEFSTKVFGYMAQRIHESGEISLSSFNEDFSTAEISKITRIIHDLREIYGENTEVLHDNIASLNRICESRQGGDEDKDEDDLLKIVQKRKEQMAKEKK